MATIYNIGRTAKPKDPFYQTGKHLQTVSARLNVTVATAAANDVYVLAEGLSFAARIHRIRANVASGTLTAANDNNIGFYKYNSAGVLVAIDDDALVDGADYSGGIALGTDLLAGLSDANVVKSIGELLSLGVDAEPTGGVVLGLKTVVAPTTNNRVLDFDVVIEEATRN